jgi:selenium metabolism protein YedF
MSISVSGNTKKGGKNMITVNAIGDNCPIPVIKTKKAMQALTGPETIEVLVDNEIAVQNVTKMASSSGGKVTSKKLAEKEYKITIAMEGAPAAAKEEDVACIPDMRDNTVVVVSSDRMGVGNDELGKVLIKGFIFAVTQLDRLPKTMLFYNGGATITCEGSDSLNDLKSLEAQGVEILTCGTCLDYYGLKEKLAVGSVTNMYSIVEKMAGAGKILKP